MIRLLGLMISIGLADSVNPSTIAPALYLATREHPRRRVAEFTIAVFVVNLAGGALIALGPGQLIRSLVPHPHRTPRHIAEIVAGAILIVAAVLIWRRRERFAGRGLSQGGRRRGALALGATITVVELPTAFPYFAAIAAVVGSGLDAGQALLLLLIFNMCFVVPLIGIVITLTVARERSGRILAMVREFLERRWPHILAIVMAGIGVIAVLIGATGLLAVHSGFFRHVRGFFHLKSR